MRYESTNFGKKRSYQRNQNTLLTWYNFPNTYTRKPSTNAYAYQLFCGKYGDGGGGEGKREKNLCLYKCARTLY